MRLKDRSNSSHREEVGISFWEPTVFSVLPLLLAGYFRILLLMQLTNWSNEKYLNTVLDRVSDTGREDSSSVGQVRKKRKEKRK